MEELVLYTPQNVQQYVQHSVAFSRNMEEEYGLLSGGQEYRSFAGLISCHLSELDTIFESLSEQAASYAVNLINEEQFKNPKNGRLRNWVKRNIHVDVTEKQGQEIKRFVVYGAVRGISEIGMKFGIRALISALDERDRLKFYSGIYNFLHLMANSDPAANQIGAAVELEKIRSSFDLNAKSRSKVREIASANNIQSFDELDFGFLNHIDSDTKLGLAYLLYSLACRMYDDEPEPIADKLKLYYDILGYHDKRGTEVLRLHRQSYEAVMDNQHKMHVIASQMVNHIIPENPSINMKEIERRCQEISKFDPYAKRQKKVKKGAGNAATFFSKAVPVTIQELCLRDPVRMILAASEALSQFNLTNARVQEESANTLQKWFGNQKASETVMASAQSLAANARSFT